MPVTQVATDAQLQEPWPCSAHARRADRTDILASVANPLRSVTVADVQAPMDALDRLGRRRRERPRSRP